MFSVQEIPFSYRGSWFDISPVVGREDLRRRPAPGLAPDRHARRPAAGARTRRATRADTASSATPALLTLERRRGRDRPRLRAPPTPSGCAGTGLGIAVVAAERHPDPVQRHLLLPRPGRRRRTSSPSTRPAAVTGSPCSTGALAESPATQALGTAERGLDRAGDGRHLGDRHRGVRDRPRRRTAPDRPSTRSSTAAEAEFADFVDAVAPWRDDRHPGRRARRLRAVVGDRRPAGLRHPARPS